MAFPDTIPAIFLPSPGVSIPPPGLVILPESHPALFSKKHYMTARGLYRILNDAGYWFYWGTDTPQDGDTPQATNATLPYTTTDTFTDGIYYFAVKYFNGCILSPFRPVGPNGERYLRLDLDSGTEKGSPPAKPLDVFLEVKAGGIIRVHACYFEVNTLRADTLCITATFDGSDPAVDTPDYTVAIASDGPVVLTDGSEDGYDLPAQVDGTTVKVRVQTRRDDNPSGAPDYRYSDTDSSDIYTADADAVGPAAPGMGVAYSGSVVGV